MSEPLITVVMSVHNGARTLESAVRSLLWQTFTNWELIIVDDASTDATQAILRRFCDSRIQLVTESERKGLATRLNQCIARSRGQYLARMDADDVAYPERFERQVRFLQGNPDIDLLGHGAVLINGNEDVFGVYPSANSHEDICRRPWWGFPLAHPTWMGKQTWFVAHPYNEKLSKGQDQDLLLRSFKTSRFAALPDILLGYRIENISVLKSARGRLAYCRELLVQARDCSSIILALRGMIVHGVALVRDLLFDLMGTMHQGVRRSFGSADESTKNQWKAVWHRLSVEDANCGVKPR